MARVRSRNRALTFYTSGRYGKSLEGLQDIAGQALSMFDTAVERAVVGLRRRVGPAVNRAVREHYNVKRALLTESFRVQDGSVRKHGNVSGSISVWASTRKLPLVMFGGRWGGRRTAGATAAIVRSQRKTYAGAFIATGRFRGETMPLIFTRIKGEKQIQHRGYHRGKLRESIRALRGPSPFEMISGVGGYTASVNARDQVMEEMRTYYINELRRQFALRNK